MTKTLITFRDGSTGYLASKVATELALSGNSISLGNYGARYIENVYNGLVKW